MSKIFIEVIEVPYSNTKFDLVLVCSKEYKRFLFKKKEILLRFEYLKNKLVSAQRKINTTIENK